MLKGNGFIRLEQPFPSCYIVRNYDTRCVSLVHLGRKLCLSHDHSLSISGCGDFQSVILAARAVLFLLSCNKFSGPQDIVKHNAMSEHRRD